MKPRAGFTIVELLIVLALLAVLSTVMFLNFPGARSNQQLSVSAGKLADDLQKAHIFSREHKGEKVWGVAYTSSDSYAIISFSQNQQTIEETKKLPAGITFNAPFQILFERTGGLTRDTFIQLHNVHSVKKITVLRTGVVEIEK